jgi:ribosome maturation protein SDO1
VTAAAVCRSVCSALTFNFNSLLPAAAAAGDLFSVVCLVEPGTFRSVHTFIQTSSEGAGRLEVLSLAATGEAEADVGAAAAGLEGLGLAAGSTQAQQQQQQAQAQVQQQQQRQRPAAAASSSGFVAAGVTAAPVQRQAGRPGAAAAGSTVVYPRGPVGGLPEEHASRRERFAELDELQPGWSVELRSRGEGATIDAVFFSPAGDCVGAYANARRMALRTSKAAAGGA